MNREDIIRVAREAGFRVNTTEGLLEELERFAALVASAEREKVATWMMQCGYATGHGDTIEDLLKELDWQAKEREREACAKVCDIEMEDWDYGKDAGIALNNVAAAIRARGQA